MPPAVALQPPDLGAQLLVDLPDPGRTPPGWRREAPAPERAARRRRPGYGSDQPHDRGGVVGPVAGAVAFGLRQQADLVVVAHRPHRHPGVGRQLADGEHGFSLPQALFRR